MPLTQEHMMKKTSPHLVIMTACVLLYSGDITAACTRNSSWTTSKDVTMPVDTFNIPYDDASVQILKTYSLAYMSSAANTYADASSCGQSTLYGEYMNGWGTPDANGFVATNIAGVRIKVSAGVGGASWYPATYGPAPVGTYGFYITDTTWDVQIKKTGQITAGNTLTSGLTARFRQYNSTPNSSWILSRLYIPAGMTINVLSCTLKNTVPTIIMGDWYDTQFKNIGDKSTDVSIPITLTCKAGTNIKATITSTDGFYDAATGILNLSSASTATGVAIQLVDSTGIPIPLGAKNTVKSNVSAGDVIFGWKARYIKTASSISPGTANASATVNIVYE